MKWRDKFGNLVSSKFWIAMFAMFCMTIVFMLIVWLCRPSVVPQSYFVTYISGMTAAITIYGTANVIEKKNGNGKVADVQPGVGDTP